MLQCWRFAVLFLGSRGGGGGLIVCFLRQMIEGVEVGCCFWFLAALFMRSYM